MDANFSTGMQDYANMRQGIVELMDGFDPVPNGRVTGGLRWTNIERRAAAERLGLDLRDSTYDSDTGVEA
jgi:hypothetical protein